MESSENINNWLAFSNVYDPFHIPLTLCICGFGVITHSLNILVLTQRHMRSPMNTFLTALSSVQLILLLNYVSLQCFELCRNLCIPFVWSHSGALFKYLNVNLNVVLHTTALGLTLSMAMFRAAAVHWPLKARLWMSSDHAKRCCTATCVLVPIVCIPAFLSCKIDPVQSNIFNNCSGQSDDDDLKYDLTWTDNDVLLGFVFWEFSILLKLVPCFLFAVLCLFLAVSLKRLETRKARLKNSTASEDKLEMSWARDNPVYIRGFRNTPKNRSRITRMLIALVLLCVIVEFPQGLLSLLSAVSPEQFLNGIYDNVGNFFEMLTLLYSSINFVIYCAMNSSFQATFCRLIRFSTISGCKRSLLGVSV